MAFNNNVNEEEDEIQKKSCSRMWSSVSSYFVGCFHAKQRVAPFEPKINGVKRSINGTTHKPILSKSTTIRPLDDTSKSVADVLGPEVSPVPSPGAYFEGGETTKIISLHPSRPSSPLRPAIKPYNIGNEGEEKKDEEKPVEEEDKTPAQPEETDEKKPLSDSEDEVVMSSEQETEVMGSPSPKESPEPPPESKEPGAEGDDPAKEGDAPVENGQEEQEIKLDVEEPPQNDESKDVPDFPKSPEVTAEELPPKDAEAPPQYQEAVPTGTPTSDVVSESSQKTSESSGPSEFGLGIPEPTKTNKAERSRKKKSSVGVMTELKFENTTSLYPETLSPFQQPKEALNKILLQLENPEWEVVMQGLQGLVRISENHSKLLQPVIHTAMVLLTRQIRNLRSQVARAACQAANHIFHSLTRALDNEVEDIAGALLSRMADTNKFLRGDSNSALEAMIESVSPGKSISALVNRGAKHQNSVVRAATSRLLYKLCHRLGHEKVLALPRESRSAILITGAKMLTEGSLDTRRYAKETFVLLSADPRLSSIMTEVVPSNILRSISKVMAQINVK